MSNENSLKENQIMCHLSRENIFKNEKKIHIQKALQEVHVMTNNNFQEKKQKLLDETQSYMYAQSSKFSSVARQLIFGILGTIWVFTFTEGKFQIPNFSLVISLFLALLFLFVDTLLYFVDSMCYQKELYNLDNYKGIGDIIKKHEPYMDKINRRSNNFLVWKFIILLLSCMFFIGGILLIFL